MLTRFRNRWHGIAPNYRRVLVLLIVACALLVLAEPALACPTCKDSITHGPNSSNLVRGYFWSIVFMMSMPFFILSGVGGYFYWEVRKARARLPVSAEPAALAEIKMTRCESA